MAGPLIKSKLMSVTMVLSAISPHASFLTRKDPTIVIKKNDKLRVDFPTSFQRPSKRMNARSTMNV